MTHSSIQTYNIPGIENRPLSGAVRHQERVYLSGANASGRGLGLTDGDPRKQAHAALDQLEESLASVGGSLAHITKLTTCLVDRGYSRIRTPSVRDLLWLVFHNPNSSFRLMPRRRYHPSL